MDEFWRCFCDLFDVHPTFCGGHDEHRFGLTVDEKGEVVLVSNRASGLDVEVANHLALGSGLDGDQHVAKDVGSERAHLFSRERDFHPTFHDKFTRLGGVQVALPTTTSVDLTLHGDHLRTEAVIRSQCLIGRRAVDALKHGYAVALEHGFALVFVDVHGAPDPGSRWAVLQHSA